MIVQAINACYDVHVPERSAMTVAEFRAEMGLLSLWPSNTMVVLEDKDPIAVIVGTKRPYGCWIAKLGVQPGYQRQGVGRYVVEALMRKLAIIGPRVISVDVLADNAAGMAFFNAVGFEIWARYRSFEGRLQPIALANQHHVRPVTPDVALPCYASWHTASQCWERDAHTLHLYGPRLTGYAFWEAQTMRGYILLHNAMVMDLAIDPGVDPFQVGRALLGRATMEVESSLRLDKVPTEDPICPVLERVGFASRESHVQLGRQVDRGVGAHDRFV